MTRYLDYNALTNFLEESFKDKQEEIKSLNKYYQNEKSLLYNTYHFIQVSQTNDAAKYMVIVFQDLPYPYPDLITKNIKTFMGNNKLECEYQTWETYQSYETRS